MGHKGVSKRKPKQSNNVKDSSNARPGASSAVQDLMKGKETPANSGGTNSYTGSSKKNKKGK
jgi:hypothetical protein